MASVKITQSYESQRTSFNVSIFITGKYFPIVLLFVLQCSNEFLFTDILPTF